MPNSDPEWRIFLSTPYTHDRYFFLHTFWFTTFGFSFKESLLKFKEVDATSDRRSVIYVYV